MAQYLGQMGTPTPSISDSINKFTEQMEARKAQKLAMALEMIKSGQYSPTSTPPNGPPQSLFQRIGQGMTGPNLGGQNMNVMGQNFQMQTPQNQGQNQATKMSATLNALDNSPMMKDTTGGMSGYQKPEIKVDSDGNATYDIKPQTTNKYAIPADSLKGQVAAVLNGTKAPILLSKYGGVNSQYSQVMNEVYKQNPNYDENNSNISYAAERGNVSALEKSYSNTRAFENTARSNLALAMNLSKKVDRSGSPILNKAYLAWKNNVGGDADTAAFEAAVNKFSTEWAKVTTNNGANGSLTNSARDENERLLNAAQNQKQFMSVAQVALKEMQNRNIGYRKAILEARDLNKKLFDTTSKDENDQDAEKGFNETGGGDEGSGFQQFEVDGQSYNIPDDKVEAFKKAKGL